jgi:hypothetical protein
MGCNSVFAFAVQMVASVVLIFGPLGSNNLNFWAVLISQTATLASKGLHKLDGISFLGWWGRRFLPVATSRVALSA